MTVHWHQWESARARLRVLVKRIFKNYGYPSVDPLLRNRTRELGLGMDSTRELSRELAASVTMERTRSLGMSL